MGGADSLKLREYNQVQLPIFLIYYNTRNRIKVQNFWN